MKKEIKILLAGLVLILGWTLALYYFPGAEKKNSSVNSPSQSVIYESQTDSEEQVSVIVTPKNLAMNASVWEFEVVLDTHSAELDDDLAKNSALVDSSGNKYFPLGWEGDPPGGHHRKVILKFQPLTGRRESVELKIFDVGGVGERAFSWRLF